MLGFFIGGLLLLPVTFTLENVTKMCCGNGGSIIERRCSSGEPVIEMECKERYFLDPNKYPESDQFMINPETGYLLEIHRNDEGIPPSRYCLSPGNSTDTLDVALVCFPPPPMEFAWEDVIPGIYKVLMGTSVLFLLLTLVVYIILPELQNLQGKVQMALISSLAMSYMTIIAVHYVSEGCEFQAYWLYFWALSSFFWLNISTFNIWRTICYNCPYTVKDSVFMTIFVVWGFGFPLIMCLMCYASEYWFDFLPKPNFGRTKCFFEGPESTLVFFNGPIAILLTINMILFIHTSWHLWKHSESNNLRVSSKKKRFWLYLKMFGLMGILWIFEVISYKSVSSNGNILYWVFTDCLNCLQGFMIFLILVVFRKRVRKALAVNKVLNIPWPASWREGEDIESISDQIEADTEENTNSNRQYSRLDVTPTVQLVRHQ